MMSKTLFALAMAVAFSALSSARAGEPSRPGAGSSTEDLPSEAAYDEGVLADASDLALPSDTVEERRRFDRRLLQLGVGTGSAVGTGSYFALVGVFAEANVWERLALGAGAGVNFWGLEASGYIRFRPVVWGGEGHRLLNAFALRAEYTITRQGGDPLSFCDESCGARFVDRTAQLVALSAGFEHQLWSGWTVRYDFGFARVFAATPWKCERDRLPASCDDRPPSNDMMVTAFALSHSL